MSNEFKIGDGEGADAVICANLTNPMMFEDNLVGECAECGTKLQYRPHAPKARKLCILCAMPIMQEEAELDSLTVEVTPKTMDEVNAYLRKKSN